MVREFDAPVSTDILLGWTVLDRRVWPVRMEGGFGDFFFFFYPVRPDPFEMNTESSA